MGEEVTEHLGAYARPHLAERRAEYRRRLAGLLEDLYLERPFDAFVVPSDSYFYLRDAPAACAALGVPLLCVQKETTIAPWNMEVGTKALREHAPLIARHMTVCSERHREYWERSGAPRERMTVTGQPRFDFYADMPRERLPYGDDGPIILFFSYLPDFYHPGMVGSEGKAVWQDLLDRTEEELWALAAEGYRVLVKPHPLQPFRVEERRIRARVGALYGTKVFVLDGALDSRRLIAGSDIAVGFQSTVLIEAMVAGLPTLYTSWDPECRAHRGDADAVSRVGRADRGRPRRRRVRRHRPRRPAGAAGQRALGGAPAPGRGAPRPARRPRERAHGAGARRPGRGVSPRAGRRPRGRAVAQAPVDDAAQVPRARARDPHRIADAAGAARLSAARPLPVVQAQRPAAVAHEHVRLAVAGQERVHPDAARRAPPRSPSAARISSPLTPTRCS